MLPALLLACCLAVSLGCGSGSKRRVRPIAASSTSHTWPPTSTFRKGLSSQQRPVVVLVPGGGWLTADPNGLRPLAARLAARGVPTVTITYRAAD